MKHIPHLLMILTCVACTNASTPKPEPEPEPKPIPTASVRFISPNATVFTNATVPVTLEVTGSPDRLELYRDGNLLATVPSPYTYRWDTSLETEGEHQLTAKAWLGSTAFSSEAVLVNVDRTAPTFTLSPAPGTEGVSVSTPAKAVFSEAIQTSTINAASVGLKGGSSDLAHTRLMSVDRRTLTITPSTIPSAPTTITATLKNTITDLAGNAITPPKSTWTWNVPWLLPVDTQPISKAISSTLVLDRNDAPVMVWEEADTTGTRFKLRVKRWNGTGWTAIGSSLSVAPGQSDPHNPTLRLDGSNRPVIAWDQYQPQDQKEKIFVRRWDGTNWVALGEGLYAALTGVLPNSASLDLDANGNPTVAWPEDVVGTRHIYVRRWNGSSWQALSDFVSALDGDGTFAMNPRLKLDANGTPVLAWQEYDGAKYKRYVRRWNGTAWAGIGEGFTADTGGNGYANSMSLQLESNGNPVLAWDEYGASKLNIYLKRWNGTAWVPYANTVKLSAEIDDANGAILALDAQNNPVLVWSERDGFAVSHVFYRRFANGAWQAINGPFLNKPGHSNFVTALHLDAQGDPVIAWGENHLNQLTAQVVHVNK